MGGHKVRPVLTSLQPLASQIQHVHIGSQARVVRQVISNVVGIVIDDDVIAVPQPVVASIVIVRSCLKEESADVKALAVAAVQPPDVPGPEGPGEASVLPGMIKMIVRISPAGFVPHPAIVLSVNVRRGRMPGLVLICPSLFGLLRLVLRWFRCRSSCWSRAVLRDMSAAYALLMRCMLLRCLVRLIVLFSASFLCQSYPGKNRCDHYEKNA